MTIKATNEDTTGPYFPISFVDPGLADLSEFEAGTVAAPEGQPIILEGSIVDKNAALAHGVLLEFWQANAHGVYRTPATQNHRDIDPWFFGFGRLRSGDGTYRFKTILPGAAPGRAPNITLTLFSDGFTRLVTQLFFQGDPLNETDPLLQSLDPGRRDRLIAQRRDAGSEQMPVYRFDISLAGDAETPFFDDLES